MNILSNIGGLIDKNIVNQNKSNLRKIDEELGENSKIISKSKQRRDEEDIHKVFQAEALPEEEVPIFLRSLMRKNQSNLKGPFDSILKN